MKQNRLFAFIAAFSLLCFTACESLDLEPEVQQQRQTTRTQQTQTVGSQQNQASSGQQSQKAQTLQETQTSTAATNPVNTGFQPSYVDGQNQSPVTQQNTSSNANQSSHIAAHKTQPTVATTTRQENNSAENNSTENNSAENNSAENNSAENNSAENNSAESNSTENNLTEEPVEDIFNPSFSDIAESDLIDSDEAFFMTELEPENASLSSATRLAQGARTVTEEKAQKIGTTPTGTRLPENTVTVKESTSSVQTTTTPAQTTTTPVQTTTTTPVQTTTTTPVQTTTTTTPVQTTTTTPVQTTTTTPVQTAITTTTSSASSSPAKTTNTTTVPTSTTTASSTQTQTDVEETPTYSTTITPEIPTVTNTAPIQSFTPSRTVTLRTKEYLECTYPGTGWVYLGETVQTPLMDYRGRNISTGDTLFTLQAKQEGTTYLHFYKYDALADTFIDDYLEVIVKGSGSSDNRVRAPQYELIVPERLEAESQHAASSTLTGNDTLENANANAATSSADTNASGNTSTTTSSAASTAPSTSDNAGESSVSTVIQTTESSSASDTARNTSRTSSATPLTNTTESNNADTTNLSADDLLALAQKAYDAKEYEDALMYLNDFFEKTATRLDEGLYLKGQTLEAPSSVRNIRSALETYETLVAQYPESKLWEKANQRITYLKRFYFNIR